MLLSLVIALMISAPPELVAINAGTFSLGCRNCLANDNPVREESLPSFRIAKHEVTVAQYKDCVTAGACSSPPEEPGSTYFESNQQLPVNHMSRYDAVSYCAWANMRLCTASEWEAAGRTTDGRLFPWGTDAATCDRSVGQGVGCNPSGPQTVGSKGAGNSAAGVTDLLGNVAEWVADCNGGLDEAGNPSCSYGHLRGGGFQSKLGETRLDHRSLAPPYYRAVATGIRCCADAP